MPATITDIERKPKIEIYQSLCMDNTKFRTNASESITYRINTLSSVNEISIFFNESNNIELFTYKTSRKGLIESVTQPSRTKFMNLKLEELYKQYFNLGFTNGAVLEIGIEIIKYCISQKKFDIKISKTGDNEILIFRENLGLFNNIIIDADCDVEFLHIPVNREGTYNEHYSFIDGLDTFILSSKL